MSAGMDDQGAGAQRRAAVELDAGEGARALAHRGMARREVDEIGGVRDQRPDPARPMRRPERRRLGVAERPGPPLARVLDEDLHRRAPQVDAALDGAHEAAGDRNVGAEEKAVWKSGSRARHAPILSC
jgi:hypothetical protein